MVHFLCVALKIFPLFLDFSIFNMMCLWISFHLFYLGFAELLECVD